MSTDSKTPGTISRKSKALLGAVGLGAIIIAGGSLEGVMLKPGAAIAQNLSESAPSAQAPASAPPSFADLAAHVTPAVVSVRVKTAVEQSAMSDDDAGPSQGTDPFEQFFRQFRDRQRGGEGGQGDRGWRRQQQPRQFGMSLGSGFFISADGYVVTNNHVVDKGMEVQVITTDNKTLDAKVVGTDPKTDLALLKVQEPGTYPFVQLAPKSPRVGDWVMAVGNPFGLGGTVTAGIVSARGRDIGAGPYDDFLQIDASVNRGNSGGPTFNLNGEVVGVNTAIASPNGGGSVGIAFAIPADTVKTIVADLKNGGTVERGFLGVQIQPVTKEIAQSVGLDKSEGAIVAKLESDSPAAKAGIRTGDIVQAVDGKAVNDARDLSRDIAMLKPGSSTDLKVWRDGSSRTVSVKLGRLPGDQKTASLESRDNGSEAARLGLRLAPADSVQGIDKKGVLVTGVEPGSQAEDKGLKTGDVIAEVGGKAVSTPSDVRQALAESRKSGRKAVLMRIETEQGARFVALPVPSAG